MRIAHLNVIADRSTGRIAVALCRVAMREGHRALFCYSRSYAPADVPGYRVGSDPRAPVSTGGRPLARARVVWEKARHKLHIAAHVAYARLTDRAGFCPFSRGDTSRLVRQLRAFKPDVLHLHNLHGYYLYLPTLFDYIRRENLPVVWTLHDCWAFTGHCAYYTLADCARWQNGCGHCPLKRLYPASYADQSARNWRDKRALFTGLPYLVLVTPSEWLRDEAQKSFLGRYPVYALPNGVDLDAFKPCKDERFLRDVAVHSRLADLGDRHIVLSVAAVWEPRKGLDDLVSLAEKLGDDYRVVAVGLDEYQLKALPAGTALGLPRAGNLNELCALYTAADVYVSASHEETMGMTLVEALACGTQVLCYDATAMPEIVTPLVGAVAPLGDIDALAQAVRELCAHPKSAADCRARAEEYDQNKRFAAYLRLYENMYRHSPAYLRALDEAEKRRAQTEAARREGFSCDSVE